MDGTTHARTEPQQRYYIPTATRCAGIKIWYQVKGLIIRNTHVKYESPNSCGSWVMANVKVFVRAYADANPDTKAMTYAPWTFVLACFSSRKMFVKHIYFLCCYRRMNKHSPACFCKMVDGKILIDFEIVKCTLPAMNSRELFCLSGYL